MSELYTTRQELLSQLPAEIVENPTFIEALQLAIQTHSDQQRDGDSYLETHIWPMCLQVYNRYKFHDQRLEAVITAILHDIMETNRDITSNYLCDKFGKTITENLLALTKSAIEDNDEQTQIEKYISNRSYLARLSKIGGLAVLIKLEDRLANLRSFTKDVFIMRPDKYRRYIREAEELFIPLAQKFDSVGSILEDLEKEIRRIKQIIKEQSELLSI